MMKSIKYILVMALCFLAIVACNREKYLDIQPKNVITPATLGDYRLILDNTGRDFFEGGLVEGFQNTHNVSRFLSDNIFLNPEIATATFVQETDIRAYMFDDVIYNVTQDDPDWNNYYAQIYAANIVLDGLQSTEGNAAEKMTLEAEAKLHRAYAYLNLVNLYATHYNPASASTDLGVPIREGIALAGIDFTRASVQEVYDLIIEDLLFGTQNLPDTQPIDLVFRPSKAAAYTLLSRVYLYQASYEQALSAASAALTLKNELRDINNDPFSFFNPAIRAVVDVASDTEIILYKTISAFAVSSPSDELIGLYENGDIRRQWYGEIRAGFGSDIDGLYYGARFIGNNSVGLNTPELYLNSAEANARLGNITAANDALNTLRTNRFTPADYVAVNITDQATLLQFIKDERCREFATSIDRLFDIKRYNLFDNDNISITHTYNNESVTIAPNSPNFVMPIGLKYIESSPEIIQNPRE